MPEIPWTHKERQERRRDNFVYSHSLSDRKQNLIAYIMPTAENESIKGEYNVTVPELGNQLLRRVTKAEPAGGLSANGSGIAFPRLRVGQPVLINFLGNKTQPIITHSFPFSGTDRAEYGIDKKSDSGRSVIYQPAQNTISRMFNGWGTVAPVVLRDQSKVQPKESAAQVEIPGSYDIFTDDGKRYRFGLSNDFDLNTDITSAIEGKRGSAIDRPINAAQQQSKRLPYEINNALERIYSIAEGQFLPKEIRESQIGDEYREIFDPILERLEGLEDFFNGAEQFVEDQIEWFEENIIKPGEEIIDLWKDVLNRNDILDAFGLEQFEIDIGIIPTLDQLVFSQIPSTGIGIVDAAISFGVNKLKETIVKDVLGDVSLPSLDIGGLGEIGLSLFGSGGSASLEKYSPGDETIINIDPPKILSEGSAVYETLKYGHKVVDLVTSKAQQIGALTSSVGSLVEGISVEDSESDRASNRKERRSNSQFDISSKFEFSVNPNFDPNTLSILSSPSLSSEDDLILVNQQSSITGEVTVNKLDSRRDKDDFSIVSQESLDSPRNVKPVVSNLDNSEPDITDDSEFRLLDPREGVNVVPILAFDGQNLISESVVLGLPHTKTYNAFGINLISNSVDSSPVIETSIHEDFSTIYEAKDDHSQVSSDTNKEVVQQSFNFSPDSDYLYIRARLGNLVFPIKKIKKPTRSKNVLSYSQDYSVSIDKIDSTDFDVEVSTTKTPDSRAKELLVELIVEDKSQEITRSEPISVQAGSSFNYSFDIAYQNDYSIRAETYNSLSGERSDGSAPSYDASFSSIEAGIDEGTSITIFDFTVEDSNDSLPNDITVEVMIQNSQEEEFKDFEHYKTNNRKRFSEAILFPQELPSDTYDYKLVMKSSEGQTESEWKELDLT